MTNDFETAWSPDGFGAKVISAGAYVDQQLSSQVQATALVEVTTILVTAAAADAWSQANGSACNPQTPDEWEAFKTKRREAVAAWKAELLAELGIQAIAKTDVVAVEHVRGEIFLVTRTRIL